MQNSLASSLFGATPSNPTASLFGQSQAPQVPVATLLFGPPATGVVAAQPVFKPATSEVIPTPAAALFGPPLSAATADSHVNAVVPQHVSQPPTPALALFGGTAPPTILPPAGNVVGSLAPPDQSASAPPLMPVYVPSRAKKPRGSTSSFQFEPERDSDSFSEQVTQLISDAERVAQSSQPVTSSRPPPLFMVPQQSAAVPLLPPMFAPPPAFTNPPPLMRDELVTTGNLLHMTRGMPYALIQQSHDLPRLLRRPF